MVKPSASAHLGGAAKDTRTKIESKQVTDVVTKKQPIIARERIASDSSEEEKAVIPPQKSKSPVKKQEPARMQSRESSRGGVRASRENNRSSTAAEQIKNLDLLSLKRQVIEELKSEIHIQRLST